MHGAPFVGKAKVEDGDVEVRVYARPEQSEFARRHLEAAIGAIEKFSALFVPYPWPIMTVIDPPVDAMVGAGGMEYPTFVTTAGDSVFTRPGMRLPEFVDGARGRPQLVPGHARVERGRRGVARRGRQRVGRRPA